MSSQTNNPDFKLDQLFNVSGKVALITGGGSGIGLMCTQALAVNGAKVYVIGRTEEKLETVAERYSKGIPGQIIPIPGDITKKAEIARLVKEFESKEPHLDILINNAGISSSNQLPEGDTAEEFRQNLFDADSATFEDWESTYRTNVPQIYFMTTAFLPLLARATTKQHGYSSTVINIGSISGMVKRAQNHFAYNASKAAAHHLSKLLASEISTKGIKVRINTLAPGVFPSEMTAHESDEAQKSSLPKERKGDLPSQRPGNDRDMGNAVLFMCTNQYLNGQTVAVDGGYLLSAGT